jgi:hypothetical protein
MKQGPCLEANIVPSASEVTHRLLWNQKVHSRVHKIPSRPSGSYPQVFGQNVEFHLSSLSFALYAPPVSSVFLKLFISNFCVLRLLTDSISLLSATTGLVFINLLSADDQRSAGGFGTKSITKIVLDTLTN